MSGDVEALMPRARTSDLVIEVLSDETLVYDLRRHRAHCLNRAAALVWARCDGRTSVAATAAMLEKQVQLSLLRSDSAESLVRAGLEQLARARLLDAAPGTHERRPRVSRREVLRALGVTGAAALLPPLVETIVSPVSAEAASCLTAAQCRALVPPFCSGQPICKNPGNCCQPKRLSCKSRAC